MIENTEKADGGVRVTQAAAPGLDVRAVGSGVAGGEPVLGAGARVGPAEIGVLATVGAVAAPCHRRPRVVVLSTGDEVVDPAAEALRRGQVRDSNRSMLAALCREAGAEVEEVGVAGDTAGEVRAAFEGAVARGADVVVTSGGVSMGDRDLVKPVLEAMGTIHFGKVCMKPGKPLTYCVVPGGDRSVHVFGLPGNPVSSFVTFHLAVRPCLLKLAGHGRVTPRRVQAVLGCDVKMDPARPEYHRAHLTWVAPGGEGEDAHGLRECAVPAGAGHFVAVSTGSQVSSRLGSAVSALALLEIPRAEGTLRKGSPVSALLIGDARLQL